ncbi:hypothetical protein PV328_007201 [Microctonus aethiopoides]|uniref:CARD domain-containing protein n=2 Tax=Microctonus aethiopoides TaxID=144406 RepID=A0AA39KUE6_9HYME|nr:hypothetical protein PV328_007201 [Microctonus aethiopoides]
MEISHREILNRLRDNIIEDLNVHNGIITFLLNKQILNDSDVDKINVETTNPNKAATLLDILPNRGPRAFEYFQESLKLQYPWLKDSIIAELDQSNEKNITNEMEHQVTKSQGSFTSILTVPRQEKTEQLKSALTRLAPEGYVILHGMKGFGKSWLVTNVEKDKNFVKNIFDGEVYRLKFGCKGTIDDELLIQLNHLYHLITSGTSPINSEQFRAQDILRSLKQYFLHPKHKNALIILDDVWDRKIIEKFDFSCKTLVITTNIDLLGDNRQTELIEMKNGFTEAESLELFAKALNIEANKLPDEAREIHNECNGMPLLIAMFAAHFEEWKYDMAIRRDRWQYYLEALRKKDTTNHVMEKFLGKQEIIFDMCIDQLSDDDRNRYKMLVIFDEDVNITPKTLEVLWGENRFTVDEIMLSLCHKSLAVRLWNADLNIYIYGIHDLLVCHLRNKIVPAELANQHRRFVEKIYRYCDNDYSKLPLDNYSYSYIGHHLEQAKMFNEFRKIYLDLNFLQAKIHNSGINDLLIDYQKYRKYITNHDENLEENILNLESFVQTHARILADHRYRKCIDLVQIALNHHQPGFCYDAARKFADLHENYFYFFHEKEHQFPDSPISNEVPAELTTVNFTDDSDQILIGDKHGQVRQCDGKNWHPFNGHEKSEIMKVIVSTNGDYFLALNNKSTIKRFFLQQKDEYENMSYNDGDNNVTTPREKQSFWSAIHRETKDISVTTYIVEDQQISDMALSSDNKYVAACTTKGIIVVWDIDGNVISTLNSPERGFQRIIFTKKHKYIHALDIQGIMVIYRYRDNKYYYDSQMNRLWKGKKDPEPHLNDVKVIYFQEAYENESQIYLVSVTEKKAYITQLTISQSGTVCKPDTRSLADTHNCKFITATLTHDDQYLITADSDDFIKVWNINGNIFEPVASYPARAISVDTYYCNDYHIIISGYKRSVQRFIFPNNAQLSQSVKRPQFDAVMKPLGDLDIVAHETSGNKIGLYCGYELIKNISCKSQQIVSLSLNPEATKILYATNRGDVYLCDVESDDTKLIMTLRDCSSFVKFLGIENTIVCKDKDELIFWCDDHTSRISASNVVNVHCIKNNYVLTISREGNIIKWQKIQTEWHPIDSKNCFNINNENGGILVRHPSICYSSLNLDKNMLALFNVNSEMILYEIHYDDNSVPIHIEQFPRELLHFNTKMECCAFSPDGKLIAVGMCNGDISIYDIENDYHCGLLNLHCNSVRQLHWVPAAIGIPILFSINCDELAVWNVALMKNDKKKDKPSRMGMTRSATTSFSNRILPVSSQMTTSQTANANLSSLTLRHENDQNGNSSTSYIDKIRKFWSSKIPKDPNFPGLLGMISLPLSCNAKVSVSNDCNKFLSVDVHGSINNFTFFNFFEKNNDS